MSIRPNSTAALLKAVAIARSHPLASFTVPGDFPLDSSDVLKLWRRGVQARASRGLPALSARGEQQHRAMLAHQRDLQLDQRVVDDYVQRRIRHTGCRNILRTAWMQAQYPHINNQPREQWP